MGIFKNQFGITVVNTLVSMAIMGVIMLSMIAMIQVQSRAVHDLSNRLAVVDFQRLLTSSMKDGSACQYVLNHPTKLTIKASGLGPSNPQVLIPKTPLYATASEGPPVNLGPVIAEIGKPVSPFSPAVLVKSIRLLVVSGSGDSFMGRWEVDFTNPGQFLKPASVQVLLQTDPSSPSSAKVITACSLDGVASPEPEPPDTTTVTSKDESCGGTPAYPNCPNWSNFVTAQCPKGYVVTGCGYLLSTWAPFPTGIGYNYNSNAPDQISKEDNGCGVKAGGAPGCGVCFKAQAFCMKFN